MMTTSGWMSSLLVFQKYAQENILVNVEVRKKKKQEINIEEKKGGR